MTSLSAKQAAEAVGMTKQGVIKAIREGKISAKKNEKGEWDIQPVELFRVYKPVDTVNSQPKEQSSLWYTPPVHSDLRLENLELRLKLEAAEKEIVTLKIDKDDYKQRLDREAEERRKLTLLITDARSEMQKQSTEPTKGFFGWLIGSKA